MSTSQEEPPDHGLDVEALLEQLAREERELELAESGDFAHPTDRELVREFFEPRLGAARRDWGPGRFWLAAAVLVVCCVPLALELLRASPDSSQPPAPVQLGREVVTCLAPIGEVEAWSEFRWEGADLPAGTSFDLSVEAGGPVILVRDLDAESYRLAHDESAALAEHAHLTWKVTARSPGGTILGWGSAESFKR